MATININNAKYKIPERLTIEQYQKAMAFDWEDPKVLSNDSVTIDRSATRTN